MTADAQITKRLQDAIALRDKARDTEIRLRTAASIARQQAEEAKAKAKELFGVDSLDELKSLAEKTYRDNAEHVRMFEEQVQLYVTNVQEAQALLGEQK